MVESYCQMFLTVSSTCFYQHVARNKYTKLIVNTEYSIVYTPIGQRSDNKKFINVLK